MDLFLPEFFGLVLEIEADGIDFLITVVETDGGDAITCDLYILEEFIFSLWGAVGVNACFTLISLTLVVVLAVFVFPSSSSTAADEKFLAMIMK